MIKRYSAREGSLYNLFLAKELRKASRYDRIAGYFSSSILPIIAQDLAQSSAHIRILCNDRLSIDDVEIAKNASQMALRQEWNNIASENLSDEQRRNLATLYQLLSSGKLEVSVIPDRVFGFEHAKTGLIVDHDGNSTCFIGSINETKNAWFKNYEVLWSDDSTDAKQWFEEEFDALWNSPDAEPLPECIVQEIQRMSQRVVIKTVDDWRGGEIDIGAIVDDLPISHQENGLWAHQRAFIKHAYEASLSDNGARFVLADQVGLGKTSEAAIAAQLMALNSGQPVLIIAPPTLLSQWQDELQDRLDMPSARWSGNHWIDENGLEYDANEEMSSCPRQVAIVSQGLFTQQSSKTDCLYHVRYSCVIVDEAHKARRRRTLIATHREQGAKTKLMAALEQLAQTTHNMLLLTATPVQLDPIEAWDLLSILGEGTAEGLSVLGTGSSKWRKEKEAGLDIVLGKSGPQDTSENDAWEWLRNPLPPRTEGTEWKLVRDGYDMKDSAVVLPQLLSGLDPADRDSMKGYLTVDGIRNMNPFILHIIRRERDVLAKQIDPWTDLPCIEKIEVRLFGEDDSGAVEMTPNQRLAYEEAQAFTSLLQKRENNRQLLLTVLLRRAGSTITAGVHTAAKILKDQAVYVYDELQEEDEQNETVDEKCAGSKYTLKPEEIAHLQAYADLLNGTKDDPKFDVIKRYLFESVYFDGNLVSPGWIERGCVIFSEYYDSAASVAHKLSELPELTNESIGLYAGSGRSALIRNGQSTPCSREELRLMVQQHDLRLLVGTDAASEGLNLQTLGSVINLDLPWNPVRLEQRKGRIQRSGQRFNEVYVLNLRYKGSIEDRVHSVLSKRLESVYDMFGSVPDTIEDVWVDIAMGKTDEAEETIEKLSQPNPFQMRYSADVAVDNISASWERTPNVLLREARVAALKKGWK